DPRQKIKLLDELLKLNPDTQYLGQALVIYLNSYRALGDHKSAVLYAEKILKNDRNNEDALLIAAESYARYGAAPDKVLSYSAKIIELMGAKSKPAIVRQEDWERRRALYVGSAYWMIGNGHVH